MNLKYACIDIVIARMNLSFYIVVLGRFKQHTDVCNRTREEVVKGNQTRALRLQRETRHRAQPALVSLRES